MTRRLIIGAALVTALAGCSSQEEPAGWACPTLSPAPTLPAGDLASTRTSLERASAHLQGLQRTLRQAGPPPGSDGRFVLARTLNTLWRAQQAVDHARTTLEPGTLDNARRALRQVQDSRAALGATCKEP